MSLKLLTQHTSERCPDLARLVLSGLGPDRPEQRSGFTKEQRERLKGLPHAANMYTISFYLIKIKTLLNLLKTLYTLVPHHLIKTNTISTQLKTIYIQIYNNREKLP